MFIMIAGAGVAFAQEEGEHAEGAVDTTNMLYIVSGFGMALVSSVCAIAMSSAVKSFSEGVSRNPGSADKLQFGLILTLVLIETLALYVLAVLFVKVV
jgi:F0F1-type ATP synthase membrane subunit c/vacuolar-type H+-ATPase subunit K